MMNVQSLLIRIANDFSSKAQPIGAGGSLWRFLKEELKSPAEKKILASFSRNPSEKMVGEMVRMIKRKASSNQEFRKRLNAVLTPPKSRAARPTKSRRPSEFESVSDVSTGSEEPKEKSEKLKCYVLGEMDENVKLKTPATVTVKISRKKIKASSGSASGTASVALTKNKPFTIKVRAITNIKIKGKSSSSLKIPETGKDAVLKFTVIPLFEGKCSLAVDIWQEQTVVGSLKLEVTCTDKKSKTKKVAAEIATNPVNPLPERVNQLTITERSEGRKIFYDYVIELPQLKIMHRCTSPAIISDRAKYITALYEQIEDLWTTTADDVKQFQSSLRDFGAGLFNDLFPEKLQRILYDNCDKIKSIQVRSTEPFIPWELLLIKKPGKTNRWKPSDKHLGEVGLTRWLFDWWPADELVIGKGRARYVIPDYLNELNKLEGAEDERNYLVSEFEAEKVEPEPAEVTKLLKKKDGFDLLHFCCHGEAESGNISYSRLMLKEKEKNGELLPTYLTQTTVENIGRFVKENNGPIVVLNACQVGRLGQNLVGYAGFANAFINAGAGVFIGALWSVEDKSAVWFITALYDALKKGKSLGEASSIAREYARKQKDATWISYVVYGNPFAKLKPVD